MAKSNLDDLVGPFPMETPPVRSGFFAVAIRGSRNFDLWFWNGTTWVDSDDGLGDNCPLEVASGWYGKFPPAVENDGLEETIGR